MLFAVAAGGALGAAGRYLVLGQVMRWTGAGFPLGTMAVNIVGSFVMGLLIEYLAQRWSHVPEVRGFLFVGLLGGFTTFSAFSLHRAHLVVVFVLILDCMIACLGLQDWSLNVLPPAS